ncbi:MAG: alpha/beta hydrolase [Burkholderiales bacterium]|nr:alpha/beta hydrolase [Burkholderiales bacterium]
MIVNLRGHEAYCYTGGKVFNPALPTIVFIHGAQNDHSVWGLQSRYFAHHGFSVLAVDLPGHGRSKGMTLSSIKVLADWLLDLLNATGVQKAMLVGHSMGSLIALEAASRAQQRITKLALIGTAYPMAVSQDLLDTAKNNEPAAIDMVNIWSHSTLAAKPSSPGPGFYLHGMSKRLMERISRINPKQVLYTDFAACNDYTNGEAAAKALTCPVLFVLGKRDVMTPVKSAQVLINAVADSKVVLVERSGHELMAEQPDAVLDALIGFAG